MGMVLLRIKSFFQINKFRNYPITFISTLQKFRHSQEDNDQAFPITL